MGEGGRRWVEGGWGGGGLRGGGGVDFKSALDGELSGRPIRPGGRDNVAHAYSDIACAAIFVVVVVVAFWALSAWFNAF